MTLTRRRFLTISAAAACLPTAHAHAAEFTWRGVALGAAASVKLLGPDGAALHELARQIESEIARLEAIFSLYRRDSDISRLNRTGRLDAPPAEMLELLSLAGAINHHTAGAFDPTIQTLWRVHASAAAQDRAPTPEALDDARRRTGWRHVRFGPTAVRFARPGMAMTFNGIAQGFVADRIADLLRARGFANVLIDMGEINAVGRRADGTPWRVGIAAPDGLVLAEVALSDRALATSAPFGTLLDPSRQTGHIIDPRTGLPAGKWALASVSDSQAVIADALSTAFCMLRRKDIDRALTRFPGARLETLSTRSEG